MIKTPNLDLPIYDKPDTDTFKVADWNKANENIDYVFGEFKNNPNVNAIDIKAREDIINNHREVNAQLDNIDLKKIDKGYVKVSDINKNYGLIDETYIADSLKQQITGNTPIGNTPANKSITPQKTTFFEIGKNLFDQATVTNGYYVKWDTGNLVASSNSSASDYIDINNNSSYFLNNVNQIAFYDIDKVYISGVQSATNFTKPTNAVYVRITVTNSLINTTQLEIGNNFSEYEEFRYVLADKIIKDNYLEGKHFKDESITPQKTTFFKLGKNLFDKRKATQGYYVKYNTGGLVASSNSSASDYIEISKSDNYYLNVKNQVAFYDIDKKFISGLVSANELTKPEGAYYLRFTITTSVIDTVQLEIGNNFTGYEEYNYYFDDKQIQKTKNPYVTVGKNGDYTSITQSIASEYDTVNNTPLVVYIYDGVYEEVVDIRGKRITLIGSSKETCIIKNYLNDYYKPPLNMSGQENYIYNLTFVSDRNETTPVKMGSYGIHCDATVSITGGKSIIDNCCIISMQNVGLGMGTKNKQCIEVSNCKIESYALEGVFFHNYQNAGATEQKFIFRNNHIITHVDGRGAIRLADSNNRGDGGQDNKDTTISFYNNILYSSVNGKSNLITKDSALDSDSYCGYMKLTNDSFGNNVAELNK